MCGKRKTRERVAEKGFASAKICTFAERSNLESSTCDLVSALVEPEKVFPQPACIPEIRTQFIGAPGTGVGQMSLWG